MPRRAASSASADPEFGNPANPEAGRGGEHRRNAEKAGNTGASGKKKSTLILKNQSTFLVRVWGLEPQRLAAQEPKSCMSANFIIPAGQEKAHRRSDRLIWSGQRGSNSLPPPWQGGALPDELCPRQQIGLYHNLPSCQEQFSRFQVSSGSSGSGTASWDSGSSGASGGSSSLSSSGGGASMRPS